MKNEMLFATVKVSESMVNEQQIKCSVIEETVAVSILRYSQTIEENQRLHLWP